MSDYISREDALLCATGEYADDSFEDSIRETECKKIAKRLKELKPADVRENIHGEWYKYDNKYILMDEQRSYIRECMCKKCDGLAYFRISKITGKEIGNNFCPNCGADMRGE